MEFGSFWGVVLIVLGAVAALIVARIARRPFIKRPDSSKVRRETSFLHRPLNLLALLAALAIFLLGLFWRMTGGVPN